MKLFFILIAFVFCYRYSGPLSDTKWNLYSIRSDKENINYILKDVTSTIEFTDSTCLGNDGCNDYRGYYVIDKKLIQFKHLGGTAKRCVGKKREVEEYIYKYLSKLYYEKNSDTLILSDYSGVVFKYIRQK